MAAATLTMYNNNLTNNATIFPNLLLQQTTTPPRKIRTLTSSGRIPTITSPNKKAKKQQTKTTSTNQRLPGKYAVVCGRGKLATNHFGNKRYKQLLQKFSKKYSQAGSKVDKSLVVSEIMNAINNNNTSSPSIICNIDAGFVKQNTATGQWFRVSDDLAREKIGANLRDLLHNQYKSSTKAKWQRRRVEIVDEMEELVRSNAEVRMLTEQISDKMMQTKRDGTAVDDAHVLSLLTQANIDILKAIKSDKSLRLHE